MRLSDKVLNDFVLSAHSNIVNTTNNAEENELNKLIELGVTHRYNGDVEKSREMFKTILSSMVIYRSRVPDGEAEDYPNKVVLLQRGNYEVKVGTFMSLAGENNRAKQQFTWAADSCNIGVGDSLTIANENIVAEAYLNRCYSLLYLGNYQEAYYLIQRVVPFFNKYKKNGYKLFKSDMLNYLLPKMLVPLCAYLVNPSERNRYKAIGGVYNFLDSCKEHSIEGTIFDCLIYFMFLNELFPSVYGDDSINVSEWNRNNAIRPALDEWIIIPPLCEDDFKDGSVLITDQSLISLCVFGSVEEVEIYTYVVEGIGSYPNIVALMESFGFYEERDPGLLVDDCKNLLAKKRLDPFVVKKTECILETAMEIQKNNMKVMIYYQDA